MPTILRLQRISGYCAVILCLLYTGFAIVAPAFTGQKTDFIYQPQFVAAYWSAIGSLVVAYLVGEFERGETELAKINSRQYLGVECFSDSASFHSRLAEVNEGAELI